MQSISARPWSLCDTGEESDCASVGDRALPALEATAVPLFLLPATGLGSVLLRRTENCDGVQDGLLWLCKAWAINWAPQSENGHFSLSSWGPANVVWVTLHSQPQGEPFAVAGTICPVTMPKWIRRLDRMKRTLERNLISIHGVALKDPWSPESGITERWILGLSSPSPFVSIQDRSPGQMMPTLKTGLPFSVYPSRKHPLRCTQGYFHGYYESSQISSDD